MCKLPKKRGARIDRGIILWLEEKCVQVARAMDKFVQAPVILVSNLQRHVVSHVAVKSISIYYEGVLYMWLHN